MLTVAMMIGGAIVAAADDLVFSLSGYVFVFISDLFTALNGVFNKKMLDECKEVSRAALRPTCRDQLSSRVALESAKTACCTHPLDRASGQLEPRPAHHLAATLLPAT